MSPSPELVKQVAEEYKTILGAPPIMYGVTIPTCHFCGQVIKHEEKVHIETLKHEATGLIVQRFQGGCCAGTANGAPQEVRGRLR